MSLRDGLLTDFESLIDKFLMNDLEKVSDYVE